MSDFGLFESDEAAQHQPRLAARTAAMKLQAAVDKVQSEYGRFLLGATGIDEFEDRWHLSKADIRKTIEPYVFPNTGTMRRVHNAMKQEWKIAHPYKVALSHEEAGFGSMPEGDGPPKNLHLDKTYHSSDGNLVPKGDFEGWKDSVDQDGPEKVESHAFTPGGDSGSDRHAAKTPEDHERSEWMKSYGIGKDSADELMDEQEKEISKTPEDHERSEWMKSYGIGKDSADELMDEQEKEISKKEAARLVADIYTDFAQSNGLRVASLDTLDAYASTGIHEADYRLLQSMIIRQAESEECDEDCDDDEDDDSEAPSASEGDESDSGDDSDEDYDFGGEEAAEDDEEDSEDDDFGGDDEGGGEQYTVPDHAPELPPEMMQEIPQDDPSGSAPVPPEVIDSLLGLPEGTIEQLLLEEVEQGSGGGEEGMFGGPPPEQGGGEPPFGGDDPRLARRRRQATFGQDDMTDEEMWREYERRREDSIRDYQTQQHPSGVNIHTFGSTGEAYDKSQYDDNIKHGDVLSVPSEGALAVFDRAWPIPVTQQGGNFGGWENDEGPGKWHSENGSGLENSISAARDEASRLGLNLHPYFAGLGGQRNAARRFWAAEGDQEQESEGGGEQAAPAQDPSAGGGMDPAMMGGGQMMPPPGSQAVAPPAPPQPVEDQPAEDALLDTANQAIMQMIDRETQEYQQIIDPLSQALQAIQFAQQVEQAEHPMDVTPPQGTVDVSPSAAPGGAGQQQMMARRHAKDFGGIEDQDPELAALMGDIAEGVSERDEPNDYLFDSMGRYRPERFRGASRRQAIIELGPPLRGEEGARAKALMDRDREDLESIRNGKNPYLHPGYDYDNERWKTREELGYGKEATRQAKVDTALRNAAALIARKYRLSATGHQMLVEATLGRRGYEHVVEALKLVPPEVRKAAAIHMSHLFAAGNQRFNRDVFMKTVMAGTARERYRDKAYSGPRDKRRDEHGDDDLQRGLDDWGDDMGDLFGGGNSSKFPNRKSSRGRLPFELPRRTAGETWTNTPTKDAFEFPNAGETPRVDDNIDINDLPLMQGADPHGKNAASQKAVDRFQRWQERQRQRGLPTTQGESAVHNFLQTSKPYKKRVGPDAANMIHRELGLEPDAVKTPKAKPVKAVNPTLKGKGGKTPAAPKAKAPAPKAAPKTASFFARKVPGWRWDDHLSGYLSKEARAFTCSCGQKVAAPSYKSCDCGKVWNVYAIGDSHHLASDTAEVYIAREIPVRPGVIMANKKMASGPHHENVEGDIINTLSGAGYHDVVAMIERLADWTKYDSPDPTRDPKVKPPSTTIPKQPKDWTNREFTGPDKGQWRDPDPTELPRKTRKKK